MKPSEFIHKIQLLTLHAHRAPHETTYCTRPSNITPPCQAFIAPFCNLVVRRQIPEARPLADILRRTQSESNKASSCSNCKNNNTEHNGHNNNDASSNAIYSSCNGSNTPGAPSGQTQGLMQRRPRFSPATPWSKTAGLGCQYTGVAARPPVGGQEVFTTRSAEIHEAEWNAKVGNCKHSKRGKAAWGQLRHQSLSACFLVLTFDSPTIC